MSLDSSSKVRCQAQESVYPPSVDELIQAVDGRGWPWMAVDRPWMAVDGRGWPWMAVDKLSKLIHRVQPTSYVAHQVLKLESTHCTGDRFFTEHVA